MLDSSLFLPTLLTCVLLLGLVVAGGAAAMSPMLADAPGSEKLLGVRIAILALFSLPVTVAVALVSVWVCYFLGLSPTAICLVSLLPLINIGVCTVALAGLWR